jgi:hypothetical protein
MPMNLGPRQVKAFALCLVLGVLGGMLVLGLHRAGVISATVIVVCMIAVLIAGAAAWVVVFRRGTVTKEQEWTGSGSPGHLLGVAVRCLGVMGADIVERTEDHLVAETGPTVSSFCEQVKIHVESLDDGTTRVVITSTSGLPTAIDWGKSRRNINRIAHALKLKSVAPATS